MKILNEIPKPPSNIPTEQELMAAWQGNLDEPLLTIKCITYNHEPFIRDALNGFLMQKTDFGFRIVIHDDASTDNTQEIIKHYARKYPNVIKTVLQEKNLHSRGIKRGPYVDPLVAGRYVAFCEGDDYWIDDRKLQMQVDFLENHKGYAFCWTRFYMLRVDDSTLFPDLNGNYFSSNEKGVEFGFREFCYTGWGLGMPTLVYRRAAENKQHAMLKDYRDVFLISDLLHAGSGFCLPVFTTVYRQHAGGMHTGASESQRKIVAERVYASIAEAYPEHPGLVKKFIMRSNMVIAQHVREGKVRNAMLAAARQTRITRKPRAWLHFGKYLLKEAGTRFAKLPGVRSIYRFITAAKR